MEVKQRDHGTLCGEVSTITLHMEQKQEKERLARERVENLEVGKRVSVVPCQGCVIIQLLQAGVGSTPHCVVALTRPVWMGAYRSRASGKRVEFFPDSAI